MKKVEESGSLVKFVKSPQNPLPQSLSEEIPQIKLPQTQKNFHFYITTQNRKIRSG